MICPAAASAAGPVSLGALDPTPNDPNAECGYSPTYYIETAAASNSTPAYPAPNSKDVIPTAGTLTSWSVSQQASAARVRLAVVSFGPGAAAPTVDAVSALESVPNGNLRSGVLTFPTNIAVHAGEQIALDEQGTPYSGCAFPGPPDQQIDIASDGSDGGQVYFGNNAYIRGYVINLQATLQPSETTASTGPPPSGGQPTTTQGLANTTGNASPLVRRASLSLGRIQRERLSAGRLLIRVVVTCSLPGTVRLSLRGHGSLLSRARARLGGRSRVKATTVSLLLSRHAVQSLRRGRETRAELSVSGPGGIHRTAVLSI